MACKPRTKQVGLYHVINRGVEKRDIYLDDEDRQHFLEIIDEIAEFFDFSIHSYCLMTNPQPECILMCIWRCIMRTNVMLDDALVKEAILLSGVKTKKDVIALALKEFVMSRKRLNLLELAGKITFRDDYDYKACREGK